MANLALELEKHFHGELLSLLKAAGDLALSRGQNLYLVGGAVRDLFLQRPNLDLDLVIEGNAISLARRLAETRGVGEVVAHPRFGTAKFREGTVSLDIATARSETYPNPGALPVVKPGTINDDLFRRDFSINAMAICLAPNHFGELLDPYGGRDDVERGLIRVLHDKSFSDDPTRILRALRYEQRFDLRLEQNTKELMCRDAALMNRVSGDRLRHELELNLKEERPEKILSRAEELGVLELLHPALKGNSWIGHHFEQVRLRGKPTLALYMAILAYRFSEEENESLIAHLRIAGEMAKAMRHAVQLKQVLPSLAVPQLAPSAIYHLVEKYSLEAILAVAIASDSLIVCQRLELYLSELRHIKPSLNGEDLKDMGVAPGKKIGHILRRLLDAKLDGEVKSREGEEEIVRKLL
jgi:tRNA nucleotidyltransferase (CCA-adding enzyme)